MLDYKNIIIKHYALSLSGSEIAYSTKTEHSLRMSGALFR